MATRARSYVVANGTMTGQRVMLWEASCWSKLSSDKQEHLIRALTEEWDKLPQQLLDNVVQSMVRSVECCITLHVDISRTDTFL
ncbi:hypothetical protein TNCV_2165631 [Trichonephila clavipes]|nr:hypothetical protein TNCV_2165631 [Trichonephila clavipes]